MWPFEIDFFTQYNPLEIIQAAAHIRSLFLLIAEQFHTVWMYYHLFTHSSIEGYCRFFNFLLIQIKLL